MHQPADMGMWQGRRDEPDGPSALRWHQRVQPLQAEAPKGIVLLGFACDEGVQRNEGRRGAVEGPLALRHALANLAWHQTLPVHDAGDVVCADDELETAQNAYGERIAKLLRDGHLPIGLGGGHEIAWAAWQGLATVVAEGHMPSPLWGEGGHEPQRVPGEGAQQAPASSTPSSGALRHLLPTGEKAGAAAGSSQRPPRIGVLNLDAHFDLRAAWRANSGTSFRQIAEDCTARGWDFHYCVLGIAEPANTGALFERARAARALFRLDTEMRSADLNAIESTVNSFLADIDWLYLTIDLDVLPGAAAPGVSAPAAMGVAPEIVEHILQLAKASGKVRLADVAELNPRFDVDGRTARLAARLVWRLAR